MGEFGAKFAKGGGSGASAMEALVVAAKDEDSVRGEGGDETSGVVGCHRDIITCLRIYSVDRENIQVSES